MQIYYKEVSLEEGFEISKLDKHSRLVAGREVSTAAGIKLFELLRGQPITCWHCGCVADRWISCVGSNDHRSKPTLNLFATKHVPATARNAAYSMVVMMTRDHIIPKALGGNDDLQNLRPGCELCNSQRGKKMTAADQQFMAMNQHLICRDRLTKALASAERAKRTHRVSVPGSRTPRTIREFTAEEVLSWHTMIGKKVQKKPSLKLKRRPFKSGNKVNTVRGVVAHDHMPHLAFIFEEDDSQVECHRCEPADGL